MLRRQQGGNSSMIYTQQTWSKLALQEKFPVVGASALLLKDSFMQFEPNTENQYLLKESLAHQLERGVQDFRRPAIDPSLDADGNIIYMAGMEPALGILPEQLEQKAKAFMPKLNSRIGNDSEYDLFLGTLIKYLVVERNHPIKMAWAEVCFSSELLANTANSQIPYSNGMEPTGNRAEGVWADLGNVQKIVLDDRTAQFLCRGCMYTARSPYYSLASKSMPIPKLDITVEELLKKATPWIVMEV